MPTDTTPSPKNHLPSLSAPGTLARLAGVGVIILCVIGGFLYLGGWFSPDELTPARLVDGLQEVFGIHSGFRRNHAKGMCVTGYFDSNGQGARLSKAVVFQTGRVPVMAASRYPVATLLCPTARRPCAEWDSTSHQAMGKSGGRQWLISPCSRSAPLRDSTTNCWRRSRTRRRASRIPKN